MTSAAWGPRRKAAGSPAASVDKKCHATPGPGRCLFAVVVANKDLAPEDARAGVDSALASRPPQYRVLQHQCGSVVFLGDVPAHEYAPRVLVTPGSILVLVSATKTSPADVANAFATVVNDHSDPKARAVGLKLMLRELSVEARFSFVLLDLATARVFCASTALSSPLAVGHAPDGTLLVTCTRSGARAATAWPPRWTSPNAHAGAGASSTATTSVAGTRRAGTGPQLAHQYGQSPGAVGAPLESERSVSPTTDRSRSRSPSACSTRSSGSAASEASSVTLSHLPAGRFVYGRRHLQPFEFSAFWHSAEANRPGARAAHCAGASEDVAGRSAGSPHGSPAASTLTLSRVTPGMGAASGERMKYSSIGSRSDASSSWRKKSPVTTAGASPLSTVQLPLTAPATPAGALQTAPSNPMAVPKKNNTTNDDDNTWPGEGSESPRAVNPDALMNPFGSAATRIPSAAEDGWRRSLGSDSGGATDKTSKWMPRGRWTQRHSSDGDCVRGAVGQFGDGIDNAQLRRNAVSEDNIRRGAMGGSELTRALSRSHVAVS